VGGEFSSDELEVDEEAEHTGDEEDEDSTPRAMRRCTVSDHFPTATSRRQEDDEEEEDDDAEQTEDEEEEDVMVCERNDCYDEEVEEDESGGADLGDYDSDDGQQEHAETPNTTLRRARASFLQRENSQLKEYEEVGFWNLFNMPVTNPS